MAQIEQEETHSDQRTQYTFQKIQPKAVSVAAPSESSYPKSSKPSLISNIMAEFEHEEHSNTSSLSENNDDDDNEFYTNLISAINERNPLWDHRLPMADRYEPIKQMLWNEIYVALNGIYPIEILKKKWKYLREKTTSNIPSLTENISHVDKEDFNGQSTKPTKRSKSDTFEDLILKELRESRPVAPSTNCSIEEDGDLHYCKYLASLMKNIPKKKKIALQSNLICQVINCLED
ncbi:unnamed protein product [Macrosiphum euphorbiae]|uniref:MADF domain-containing protein n=1 Tax=Macrosiphum euphorbiae TaxID=13131 RepID=A0AAV0WGV5_9HEMI|nr:unnamed protein product [Macrosiphum euphorbiae]